MIDSFKGSFLSNFWPSAIIYEGVAYPSVENAYQAAKTLDKTARERIAAMTPGQAKKAGRLLHVRSDWESVKVGVMLILVRLKFQNVSLRERLLATGEQALIEGNSWGDTFWGVCDGKGRNMLGLILMSIRTEVENG
jgi:hypothetical protein